MDRHSRKRKSDEFTLDPEESSDPNRDEDEALDFSYHSDEPLDLSKHSSESLESLTAANEPSIYSNEPSNPFAHSGQSSSQLTYSEVHLNPSASSDQSSNPPTDSGQPLRPFLHSRQTSSQLTHSDHQSTTSATSDSSLAIAGPSGSCGAREGYYYDKSESVVRISLTTDARRSLFACSYCNKIFLNDADVKEHERNRPDNCIQAKADKMQLEKAENIPIKKSYTCDHDGCEQTFPSLYLLKLHKDIHKTPVFLCSIPGCGESCKKKHHFKYEETSNETWTCDWPGCGIIFFSEQALLRHKPSHATRRMRRMEKKRLQQLHGAHNPP